MQSDIVSNIIPKSNVYDGVPPHIGFCKSTGTMFNYVLFLYLLQKDFAELYIYGNT